MGPVGYYTSVGGSGRRNARSGSSGAANRQLAQAARTRAAQDKAGEAKLLADALSGILDLHRADFPPASPPRAEPPPPVDQTAIRNKHKAAAKRSTSIFDRSGRKAALAEAERLASVEMRELQAIADRQRQTHQEQLDAWWASLVNCEPHTVLWALTNAFEDNEAAAAAVGVEGTEVSLIVVVPSASAIPEKKPGVTPAGNLTLKKLTKTESADFYKLLVCGYMLVTLKEAFAVAPGLTAARIVALRASASDAYGNVAPEALATARCERKSLEGVLWDVANAAQVINDCCTERRLVQKGTTGGLQPIDLEAEPDIKALLQRVEIDDMLSDRVDPPE